MAGGSNGYQADLVSRQLTPGLISSLPGTAGLPPFISFSTSYLDATVGRIDRLNPKFNQARKENASSSLPKMQHWPSRATGIHPLLPLDKDWPWLYNSYV